MPTQTLKELKTKRTNNDKWKIKKNNNIRSKTAPKTLVTETTKTTKTYHTRKNKALAGQKMALK